MWSARSIRACFRPRSEAGRALAKLTRARLFIRGSGIVSTNASASTGSFAASLAAKDSRMF